MVRGRKAFIKGSNRVNRAWPRIGFRDQAKGKANNFGRRFNDDN